MITIKNINGTSDNKCNCHSWIEHWENYSGSASLFCSEEKCTNMDVLGAHVQKENPFDNSWYIIPLCSKHNQEATSLSVSDETIFVSANVSETCGKE